MRIHNLYFGAAIKTPYPYYIKGGLFMEESYYERCVNVVHMLSSTSKMCCGL